MGFTWVTLLFSYWNFLPRIFETLWKTHTIRFTDGIITKLLSRAFRCLKGSKRFASNYGSINIFDGFMMAMNFRVENGREFQGLVSGTEKLRNFQNLWNSSILY